MRAYIDVKKKFLHFFTLPIFELLSSRSKNLLHSLASHKYYTTMKKPMKLWNAQENCWYRSKFTGGLSYRKEEWEILPSLLSSLSSFLFSASYFPAFLSAFFLFSFLLSSFFRFLFSFLFSITLFSPQPGFDLEGRTAHPRPLVSDPEPGTARVANQRRRFSRQSPVRLRPARLLPGRPDRADVAEHRSSRGVHLQSISWKETVRRSRVLCSGQRSAERVSILAGVGDSEL